MWCAMKLFEDNNGTTSLLRVLAFLGGVTGIYLMVRGVKFAAVSNPNAGTIVIAGTGLYTACLGFKTLQKKVE